MQSANSNKRQIKQIAEKFPSTRKWQGHPHFMGKEATKLMAFGSLISRSTSKISKQCA